MRNPYRRAPCCVPERSPQPSRWALPAMRNSRPPLVPSPGLPAPPTSRFTAGPTTKPPSSSPRFRAPPDRGIRRKRPVDKLKLPRDSYRGLCQRYSRRALAAARRQGTVFVGNRLQDKVYAIVEE